MPNFRATSGLMEDPGMSVSSCGERENGAGGAPFFSLSFVSKTLSGMISNDCKSLGVSDFTFSGAGGVGNFPFSSGKDVPDFTFFWWSNGGWVSHLLPAKCGRN
jgi:hypothetical protein